MAVQSIPETLPRAYKDLRFVDPKTGHLTAHGEAVISGARDFLTGISRLIPVTATGKNTITLTPLQGGPRVAAYFNHDVYQFVADQTSDGSVIAALVPPDGSLGTLKVYIDRGGTQAGAGDITAGRFYQLAVVSVLDGGAGGLVIL